LNEPTESLSSPASALNRRQAFADTDLCVKCGLCLPHCPTYAKTLDENESPRGRLSLIQGWAAGQLDASPKLLRHLDNCLMCRACEAVCPANVPYGSLMDRFRGETGERGKPLPTRIKSAALRAFLQNPRTARLADPARALLRTTGLLRVLGFGDLGAEIPRAPAHAEWRGFHPAQGDETARVGLFLGCTAELADTETVTAAIRLLNRLGVGVSVPERQGCCGALALHAGDRAAASRMRSRNLDAFDPSQLDAIITLASGCGAMLSDYRLHDPSPEGRNFADKLKDIGQFLSEFPWPENIRFKPLKAKACVHTPCTLKNVLKAERYPLELLRRMPELEVLALAGDTRCCGAAGSYMVEHPEMASSLREDVLEQLRGNEPDYLLTSNVGCALHLRAGLKRRGLSNVHVLHPVVLLEQQLADACTSISAR
jgi:glycolate oxidase iron-sulfur subunit